MTAPLEDLSFELEVVQPFRLDLTAWALRRRVNNVVDRWVEESWQRVMILDGKPVEAKVTQDPRENRSLLYVNVQGNHLKESMKEDAASAIVKCLGTKKNLNRFYQFAANDKQLNSLANRFLGLKPPRFPSVFEAAVNGITCQQISLNVGIILLNRLTTACGLSVNLAHSTVHAFPRPADLTKLQSEEFRKLGFSRQKSRAIRELSEAIASNGFDLEKLETLSNQDALEKLCDLRGFGRWTAQYVLLRGLGRLNVFPTDDVGGRRGLQRWLKLKEPLNNDKAGRIMAKWAPYGGLIYFHLLLDRLVTEGYLEEKNVAKL